MMVAKDFENLVRELMPKADEKHVADMMSHFQTVYEAGMADERKRCSEIVTAVGKRAIEHYDLQGKGHGAVIAQTCLGIVSNISSGEPAS